MWYICYKVSLAKIVEATNQMAAGDLDKVIDIDCKGDTKVFLINKKYVTNVHIAIIK